MLSKKEVAKAFLLNFILGRVNNSRAKFKPTKRVCFELTWLRERKCSRVYEPWAVDILQVFKRRLMWG